MILYHILPVMKRFGKYIREFQKVKDHFNAVFYIVHKNTRFKTIENKYG